MDGSALAEKRTALYRAPGMELVYTKNKSNETFIIISITKYSMLKFRAAAAGDDGNFNLSSLEYLAGSTHGWNEYTLEIIGEGNFDSENGILDIAEIETVQITKGRVHRYDTRITGNDALTALRNRRERIQAISGWMTSQEAPDFAGIDEFTAFWEPVFFPEITPAKKRPKDWIQEGDKRQKAEDIPWNLGYTERVFPEELWPLRNSGTMLRDWEEALAWIYMEYEWENILDIFSDKIKFSKIK